MKKIILAILTIPILIYAQLWRDSTATKAAVYNADSICTYFLSIYNPEKDSCIDIFTYISEIGCSIYVKPDTYTTEGWVACGETVHIDTTGGGGDTCEHTLTIYKNLGQGSDTTFTISTCEGDTLEVYPDTCSYELYITRGGNYYDDIYVCKDGYFDIPYDSIYIQYGTSWSPEGYITHLGVLKIDTTKFVDTCSHEFIVYGYSWIEGNYYYDTINTCTPEILDLTRGIPVYQPLKWFGSETAGTLKVTYDTNFISLNENDELTIKDKAITTEKLADDAITSAKILNGTIQGFDLANGAITTDKIQDGAITLNKISKTGATAGYVIKFDGSDVVWAQDNYMEKDTFIAYWDSIRGIPNDIADGDDYDTLKADWNYIKNIPTCFADETDDIGDELAGKDTFVAYWDSIRQIPSCFADGVDNIGDELAGIDTMIAQWDSIRGIPTDIADGDDIDTFIAYWNYLRNIPSGFADGVDDTGHYEPKDTFIAYWDSIRNKPTNISYLGSKIDWSELASAVQDSIQDRTDSSDIANWGYEANPLSGAKKYGETNIIKGVLHIKAGENITLIQQGDTIIIQSSVHWHWQSIDDNENFPNATLDGDTAIKGYIAWTIPIHVKISQIYIQADVKPYADVEMKIWAAGMSTPETFIVAAANGMGGWSASNEAEYIDLPTSKVLKIFTTDSKGLSHYHIQIRYKEVIP